MKTHGLSRREMLRVVAVGAASMAAASCGATATPVPPAATKAPAAAQPTTTPVPAAKKLVKLTYWQHIDPPNPVYQQVVDSFNKQNQGKIEVEMQVIPWDAFHQQILTVIAANSAPDTMRLVAAWFGEFWTAKWVLPLDTYINQWDGRQNFSQASFDARRGGVGQPVICLPYSAWASMLYYRKDWFDAEGIKVPTTMDEFLDACKAVARPKENRWAYGVRGARGGEQLHNWIIYAFGGKWVDDSGKVAIDGPDAVAGAEFLVNLRRKWDVVRPDAVTDAWAQLLKGMQTGEMAMLNHGIHVRSTLTDVLGDKVAPAKLPRGKGEGTMIGLGGPAILSGTKNSAEAWEFLKHWGSKEAAEMYLAATAENMVPENTLVKDHEKFKSDPYYKMTAEMHKVPDPTPYWHPRYGSLTEKLWSPTFQKALLGEITPQQMMKTFADYMNGKD